MLRLFTTLLCFCFFATHAMAQAYRYSLRVDGLPQPAMVYFGYWYGQNAYLIDSAQVSPEQNTAVLTGQRQWPTGLYFWSFSGFPNTVNFVLNGEQQLDFSTHSNAPIDSVKVVNSKENTPYFEWLRYERQLRTSIQMADESLAMLRRATQDRSVWMEQIGRINGLKSRLDSVARQQIRLYPDLFYPRIVAAEQAVTPPRDIAPRLPDGAPNTAYYNYLEAHFWDNFDFSDERMIQTPVLPRKMDQWINIQPSELDTVKRNLDRLMQKTLANENIRYLVTELLIERFDQPSVGGNETMLVHFFDQYGRSANDLGMEVADWMRLEYKVNAYRPTLPGQVAPDFALIDHRDSLVVLSDLPAKFTLLYFFSPLCSHCKALTPQVYESTLPFLNKGLRVVAVTTDHRKDIWVNYVEQNLTGWTCLMDMMEPSLVEQKYATHTLPNILLLDEEKRIVARRLPADQLSTILQRLFP
jgi:thiol-disulfide isomerase/thioredoxin